MSTLWKTFLAIIARFRSRSGNYREKTVDIFHGDRTEEKFERSKDRCFEYDEREKKKKKKNGGTDVFNYKNIVPAGLLFVQL